MVMHFFKWKFEDIFEVGIIFILKKMDKLIEEVGEGVNSDFKQMDLWP